MSLVDAGRLTASANRQHVRLVLKRVLFIAAGLAILAIVTVILLLSVLAYGLSGLFFSFAIGGLMFVVGLALVVTGFRKAEHEDDGPIDQGGTT